MSDLGHIAITRSPAENTASGGSEPVSPRGSGLDAAGARSFTMVAPPASSLGQDAPPGGAGAEPPAGAAGGFAGAGGGFAGAPGKPSAASAASHASSTARSSAATIASSRVSAARAAARRALRRPSAGVAASPSPPAPGRVAPAAGGPAAAAHDFACAIGNCRAGPAPTVRPPGRDRALAGACGASRCCACHATCRWQGRRKPGSAGSRCR